MNDDKYEGSGYVCSEHFLPTEMKNLSDRIVLSRGVVPTVFDIFVDIIDLEQNNDVQENSVPQEKCYCHIQINLEKLKSSEVINSLNNKNKQKNIHIAKLNREINKLKSEYQSLEQKNNDLEQKLMTYIPLKSGVSISFWNLPRITLL